MMLRSGFRTDPGRGPKQRMSFKTFTFASSSPFLSAPRYGIRWKDFEEPVASGV
jgi:hypothetical protein